MAERMSANQVIHQIVVYGLSDRGLQRENNEDHFMVVDLTRRLIGVQENQLRPELFHHDIGQGGTMLMVADGLGGHEGGEIASQLAVDTVAQTLVDTTGQDTPVSERIIWAVGMAHEAICKYHGASGRTRHMASTLTAVHIGHGMMTIAQVGDSRAYRFSAGKLVLLTEDQTVVHMMQKKGMLTAEEAQNHPHRNIILQALGQDKSVLPEIQTLPFTHNDCLLLCSDGLSSYVAHERIEAIMASGEDEHMRCRHLIEAANAAGGADNVTVLLARLIVKESSRLQTTGRLVPSGAPRSTTRVVPGPRPAAGDQVPPPARTPAAPARPTSPSASSAAAKTPRGSWADQFASMLKWPWGHKDSEAASTSPATRQSTAPVESSHTKAGQTGAAGAWEPQVLKGVEDSLAEYLGPVAKILVGRAAQQTHDVRELCRLLAEQLATDQERAAFLRSALQHQQTHRS